MQECPLDILVDILEAEPQPWVWLLSPDQSESRCLHLLQEDAAYVCFVGLVLTPPVIRLIGNASSRHPDLVWPLD